MLWTESNITMVTNAELKREFDDLKTLLVSLKSDLTSKSKLSVSFDKQLGSLESKIKELTSKSISNWKEIFYLTERIEKLEDLNIVLQDKIREKDIIYEKVSVTSLTKLEEEIEERTNRQLRKTLVIKGVPSELNESWKRCSEILATIISDAIEWTSYDGAFDEIKRAYRKKGKPFRKEKL